LFAVRNWVESRSAAYLQSWKVGDFFIINHGDLTRIFPSFDLLQVQNAIDTDPSLVDVESVYRI
jgi:hypothetical protein